MGARVLVASAVGGLVWGAVATALFLAMFRGLIPAYGELFLPIAVLGVVATLPFQAAIWALTLLGRSSPQLAEVVVMTLAMGAALGMLVGVTVNVIRSRPASGG